MTLGVSLLVDSMTIFNNLFSIGSDSSGEVPNIKQFNVALILQVGSAKADICLIV